MKAWIVKFLGLVRYANGSGKWNICICIIVTLVCMLHQNACDVVRFIAYSVTTVNFTCTSEHDFDN